MMVAAKILAAIWPFVREMFFEGKTTKQIAKENKLTIVLLAILFLSLSVNWISFRKFMEIASLREHDAQTQRAKDDTKKDVIEPPKKNPQESQPASANDIYNATRQKFDEMYK